MQFINELQEQLKQRAANEGRLIQKVDEYNQLNNDMKLLQDRFAATLDESLLEEMKDLKQKLETIGSYMDAISKGLNKNFRVTTDSNIEQELEQLSAALKLKERKAKVEKAMSAYAAAIKEYQTAYEQLTKVSIELSSIQKNVDIEVLERFKKWHEANKDIQTIDLRNQHTAYDFDKMIDAAFPTWGLLNKLLLNMNGN